MKCKLVINEKLLIILQLSIIGIVGGVDFFNMERIWVSKKNSFYDGSKLKLIKVNKTTVAIKGPLQFFAEMNNQYNAVSTILKTIRSGDVGLAKTFTTENGFNQLTKDMEESKNDPRLSLLLYRSVDIPHAIPVKIQFLMNKSERHCFIDVYVIAVRYMDQVVDNAVHLNDSYGKNHLHMMENIKKIEDEIRWKKNKQLAKEIGLDKKIVFTESFARFYCDYSKGQKWNWILDFFKITDFDILMIKS